MSNSIGSLSLQLSASSEAFKKDLDQSAADIDRFGASARGKFKKLGDDVTKQKLTPLATGDKNSWGGFLSASMGALGLGVGLGGIAKAVSLASPATSDRLTRALEDFGASIGRIFAPAVDRFAVIVRGLGDFIDSVSDMIPDWIKGKSNDPNSGLFGNMEKGKFKKNWLTGGVTESEKLWKNSLGDQLMFRDLTEEEFKDEVAKGNLGKGLWGVKAHRSAVRPAEFTSAEELSRSNILRSFNEGPDIQTQQLDTLKMIDKTLEGIEAAIQQANRQEAIRRGIDGSA